ncbi:MAG TPA: hypothetical protein VEB86_00705 [Chryseosolibacter sp.]|nr:hypothetical protein [Chryseosolibacter sp.]
MKAALTGGLILGGVTSVFMLVSQLRTMNYDHWLQFHNFFIMTSMVFCAAIGFRAPTIGRSLADGLTFAAVFCGLYLVTYLVSTTVVVDYAEWMPYHHKSYVNSGFMSVNAFIHHKNNFTDLLKIQVAAVTMGFFFYLCANLVGFGIRVLVK